GRGLEGELGLPARLDEAGLFEREDIALEREGRDVGGEAVEHGPHLRAGPAMGVADGDGRIALRLPPVAEPLTVLAIELAGRIVGDVYQSRLSLHAIVSDDETKAQRGQQDAQSNALRCYLHRCPSKEVGSPYRCSRHAPSQWTSGTPIGRGKTFR